MIKKLTNLHYELNRQTVGRMRNRNNLSFPGKENPTYGNLYRPNSSIFISGDDRMGKFVIKNTNKGPMFNLLATNGQVICTSQVYASESSCNNGIESVRKNCGVKIEDQTVQNHEQVTNPKYEIYLDKAGEYRFRLKASNGEIIAASEGYTRKESCKNGIESIMKNAPDATVERI